jgi:hypothetical protein
LLARRTEFDARRVRIRPEELIPTFPIALGFPDERPQRPERRAPRVIYVSD